jgi:hypothetical protein
VTNTYKAASVVGASSFGADPFEHEFSPADEGDWIDNGHLAIVPREYLQLSDNFGATKQGEKFSDAFRVEHEAALISGGHIQRVDKPRAARGSKETKAS